MRIYDNGIYRGATQEEIDAFNRTPAPDTESEELPADEALDIILGGAE